MSAAIRIATLADAEVLAELGSTTFIEAFGHLYAPEDLSTYLREADTPAAFRRILADDHDVVLIAERSGRALGYGMGGPCKLPVQNLESRAGEIKRVYVRAEAHGQKVGSRIMDLLLAELERREHDPLYVGVWSQNLRAQRLYERYGFVKVSEYDFPVGRQLDREFILRRPPRSV